MYKFAMGVRKAALIAVMAACVIALVPAQSVFAMSASDPTPPPATITTANERLELAWARLQAVHARFSVMFQLAGQRIARAQQLIDRAKANGKDVSDLQTALDNLDAAVKQARPVFEGTNGIIASHPGFDANGNVTDQATALQTVKDLAGKYKDIRSMLQPAFQALRQAVQDIRQTNQPAATPSS